VLPRPNTVAYLTANAERLTHEGVFKGQPAAWAVFIYLCHHPDANVPPPDRRSAWMCPVDGPHHEPAVIADSTPLDIKSVRRAIDWLEDQGLVGVDRGIGGTRRKYKKYGPITIRSTNRLSDWRHRIRQPFGYGRERMSLNGRTGNSRVKGHDAPSHPVPPAKGHDASNSDTVSLSNGSGSPERKRRTVAVRRPPA
jgi:hypothetical protein